MPAKWDIQAEETKAHNTMTLFIYLISGTCILWGLHW